MNGVVWWLIQAGQASTTSSVRRLGKKEKGQRYKSSFFPSSIDAHFQCNPIDSDGGRIRFSAGLSTQATFTTDATSPFPLQRQAIQQ